MRTNIKTYIDILKTEKEIKEMGYIIENNMIKSIDTKIIAHFGNVVTMPIQFTNCCLLGHNNLGVTYSQVLKIIVEFLKLSEEDELNIKDVKNIPCRIVLTSTLRSVIGIGNFMSDEFILIDDVLSIAYDNFLSIAKIEVDKKGEN